MGEARGRPRLGGSEGSHMRRREKPGTQRETEHEPPLLPRITVAGIVTNLKSFRREKVARELKQRC